MKKIGRIIGIGITLLVVLVAFAPSYSADSGALSTDGPSFGSSIYRGNNTIPSENGGYLPERGNGTIIPPF